MKDTFDTIVAGITKNNPNGVKIQTILKMYVEKNYDTNRFDKDDSDYWTNKEIEEFEFEVYQYELFESGTITLVPEPENPYDSNAIMVWHKDMGKIGYVPRDDNINLANFINYDFDNIKVDMELESGPYKYYDLETDKVIKKTNPYYLRLYIKPLTNNIETQSPNVQSSPSKKEITLPNENIHNYDLFEWLAISNYPYQEIDINKQEPKPKPSPVLEENNTNIEPNNYKNPLIYLTGGIVFIILAIVLLISKNYILAIIAIIMSIFFIKIFMESKNNKDAKK